MVTGLIIKKAMIGGAIVAIMGTPSMTATDRHMDDAALESAGAPGQLIPPQCPTLGQLFNMFPRPN